MASRLVPDPFLQEPAVRQLPAVGDLGLHLGFAGIEAQQRRDRVDHVGEAQTGGHDVGRVELDGAVAHAALGLANTGLDQLLEQRRNNPAGGAPRGGPQGQQRCPSGGGEELVVVELVKVADSRTGRLSVFAFRAAVRPSNI